MGKLGDKYIAGFLDSDGSIGVAFSALTKRPQLDVSFSQMTSQDKVIHLIHEEIGRGSICIRSTHTGMTYTTLSVSQTGAKMLLHRISKYLVVKRHFAEITCDLCDRSVEREEIPSIREYLKIHRYLPSLPLPVHPSRGWVAGYLDGDGCLSITKLGKFGSVADLVLHVAADARKAEGLELLQKAFGGHIYDMVRGRCKQWILRLDPAKVRAILPDMAARMIVKADQAQFLLGCAKMGHFRDGINIKAGLKHLKAQPHRLNDPGIDLSALMLTVRDLPKQKRSDYGDFVRDTTGRIIGKSIQAIVEPA